MARRTGAATGTVITSPAKARRLAAKRRAEEASWAARSGPVTVRRRDELGDQDEREEQAG